RKLNIPASCLPLAGEGRQGKIANMEGFTVVLVLRGMTMRNEPLPNDLIVTTVMVSYCARV
ncbi:MAG TPA: hypothetical protein PLL10_06210, partial [Elusimicrobiales bacterium]|nr:hypothetical protein [Elusimicrobiales bacterium]